MVATLCLPVIWCWQHLIWACSNSATFPNHCVACSRWPHNVLHSLSTYSIIVEKDAYRGMQVPELHLFMCAFFLLRNWTPQMNALHPLWQACMPLWSRYVCMQQDMYTCIECLLSSTESINSLHRIASFWLPHGQAFLNLYCCRHFARGEVS